MLIVQKLNAQYRIHEDELGRYLRDGYTVINVAGGEIQANLSLIADVPTNRDQLKVLASELGIEFLPNIPTDKLTALVVEAKAKAGGDAQ